MVLAHVALWRRGDRKFWAFSVPYDARFVYRLKAEVPYEHRIWLTDLKIWLVDLVCGQSVRDLISVCAVSGICRTCWKGGICDAWERIHWNAIGTDGGGLDAKKSQKEQGRRDQSPDLASADPLQNARSLVGVGFGATESEIRKAARKQALRHHPDRGGDSDTMMAILAARDLLLSEAARQKGVGR